jgi:hypothetical protein
VLNESSQILVVGLLGLMPATAVADILTDSAPFLSSSRPDYDPAVLETDAAVEDPSYAPFSPADSDLGVQQVLGSYDGLPPVRILLDAGFGYTDNAPAATKALQGGSWYGSGNLAASWQPRIAWGWFADIGLSEQVFRFESNNADDFENFQPHFGLVKSIPELDDLVVFTRYEYQRLTSGGWSNRDYSAQRIRSGIQKTLFLTSRQQLAAGACVSFDLDANPSILERNEYLLDASYTYWLADHLSSTLSWTGSMWDFRKRSREDWDHLVGLEVTWHVSSNFTTSANLFYSNHDSNMPLGVNDFQSWQTGLGFEFNYSF